MVPGARVAHMELQLQHGSIGELVIPPLDWSILKAMLAGHLASKVDELLPWTLYSRLSLKSKCPSHTAYVGASSDSQ